jgi:ribosomal protein RSM22 (predicted rRNA methylase)
VLAAVGESCPDFSPHTLMDIGAGPGTATFAAIRHFPALRRVCLVDADPHLRALALALLRSSQSAVLHDAAYEAGEIASLRHDDEPADLVMASYVIGEIASDLLARAADALWSRTAGMLIVVEPGTPAGFLRIRALRAHLLACGAHVVCPCPHDAACPIVAPDWCHFSQRLNRSRDHRQVKGASLSFEDEKFSYVVLARAAPVRIDARVLAHPDVTKSAITAKLCVADGIVTEATARRDREAYRLRKSWRWGDAVTRPGKPA